MAADREPVRRALERRGDLFDQPARALVRLLRAFGEHRAAVLVDDLDVETLFALLDHDVLRDLGELGHVLQRLAQRRGGEREGAVLLEARSVGAVAFVVVRRRVGGGFLRRDVGGILELGPRGQAGHLDDAGIAHVLLHAEGIAHGAGDDLQLLLVLVGEGDQHHEERNQQPHQIGERHEPAVTAAVPCFLAPRHLAARDCAAPRRAPPPPPPRDDASPAGRRGASRAPMSGSWNRGSSARRR